MYRSLFVCLLMTISAPALVEVSCTSAPKEKWLTDAQMKKIISDLGYRIVVFKISSGHCYEIYGRDGAGKRIEVYFDPVDGKVVQQNTL